MTENQENKLMHLLMDAIKPVVLEAYKNGAMNKPTFGSDVDLEEAIKYMKSVFVKNQDEIISGEKDLGGYILLSKERLQEKLNTQRLTDLLAFRLMYEKKPHHKIIEYIARNVASISLSMQVNGASNEAVARIWDKVNTNLRELKNDS